MRLNKQELQAMLKNNQKIPEGWSIVLLKSLSSNGIMNGIFNNPTKVGRGIPLINVVDLYNDKIDFRNLSLLDVSEDELKRYEAILGDLLFTRSSLKLEGIAQCNIVPVLESKCVFDCHIMRIRPNDQLVVPYYLFAYCNTAMAKMQFMKLSKTTTMTTIDQDGLGQLKVLLPPLPEQEKIAEILGTWDEAIEKLSSLIEQKKLLKKGLMQKLLTGKTRLSTFTQPWKEVKLGAVLEAISRRNKNLNISRVLSVTNSRGFILPEEQFSRGVASEDLSNYKVVKNGEFAYNPSRLNVGSIDRLDNFTDGVLSPMYVIFKCNEKLSSNYMKHWITTTEFNTKVRNSAQGSVRETVDFKTLSSIKINLPSDISEQQAIADVLSTADDEINLLNQKLEALKEQKKGLMQQLLTGQVRVKVN